MKMATSTLSGGEPVLLKQCLDFCQALANNGQTISFSLTIGSTFSFNLDTREKATSPVEKMIKKKKPSPSTLRRNLLRKEQFLKKKSGISSDLEATSLSEAIFQCEHCASSFKTENGLKIHVGKSHKALKSSLSPEKVRENSEETSLTVSPLRDTRREEQETEKEEEAPSLPEEVVKLHDTTKEKIDLSPKKDDYPHPQKCCYEPCDLYFENKTEYAAHVLKHMKQGD